ncbi:MAG: hypothetical protein U0936_14575 [Planctomycetaceae bacterium]
MCRSPAEGGVIAARESSSIHLTILPVAISTGKQELKARGDYVCRQHHVVDLNSFDRHQ